MKLDGTWTCVYLCHAVLKSATCHYQTAAGALSDVG